MLQLFLLLRAVISNHDGDNGQILRSKREKENCCLVYENNPRVIKWERPHFRLTSLVRRFQVYSLQCRRFFRARECFARGSAMLKLESEKRKWSEFFPPSPSPLSFFRPSTYPKGYYSYCP